VEIPARRSSQLVGMGVGVQFGWDGGWVGVFIRL
jgi:hypothetical protein